MEVEAICKRDFGWLSAVQQDRWGAFALLLRPTRPRGGQLGARCAGRRLQFRLACVSLTAQPPEPPVEQVWSAPVVK